MPRYKQSLIEITDPELIRKSGERFHPIVVSTGDLSDQVTGKVFQITEKKLAAADEYEADYKRVSVQLKSGKDAWVYVKA